MGWTGYSAYNSPQTYAEEKAEIQNLFTSSSPKVTYEVKQLSKVGSAWYAAVKITGTDTDTHVCDENGAFTTAFVILTSKSKKEWYYKDMDELMGPNEAKAPAVILNSLSPLVKIERTHYAQNWRDRCLANIKDKKSATKIETGKVYRLKTSMFFNKEIGDIQYIRASTYLHYSRKKGYSEKRCFEVRDINGNVTKVRLSAAHIAGCQLWESSGF